MHLCGICRSADFWRQGWSSHNGIHSIGHRPDFYGQVYLSARDNYRIEREEKTGKGYADFTFHPRRRNDIAFIVELKKDEDVDVAINQIKSKEYI